MAGNPEIKSLTLHQIREVFIGIWQSSIVFILLTLLLRVFKYWWIFRLHDIEVQLLPVSLFGVLMDIQWTFYIIGIVILIGVAIGYFSLPLMKSFINFVLAALIVLELGLIVYFTKMLMPLGVDLYAYSWEDIVATVQASGELNLKNVALGFIGFSIIFSLFYASRLLPITFKSGMIMSGILLLVVLYFNKAPLMPPHHHSENEKNLTLNNSHYLYTESYKYFSTSSHIFFDFYLPEANLKQYLVQKNFNNSLYPFLHDNDYPDVLGPYLQDFDQEPDLVFILFEGLGKAYSGKEAYLGSFTPFLDSLSNHSLYWKNNLSSTGRTFGILPGVFGSLPFGKMGFLEEYRSMPDHLTMISLLRHNGYEVNYHIGADKKFDNAVYFLEYQPVDRLLDISSFDADFKPTPSKSGFSWGYADKELFQNGLRKLPFDSNKPQLTIFQTQTSHDPFIVPEEARYLKKFEDLLVQQNLIDKREAYDKYAFPYASVVYADDAIREFFEVYKNSPNFENTIFIITGDHRLPEIPMASLLDRFHVPLIIYSPKVEEAKVFSGISTHFEITPTIMAYLGSHFQMDLPEQVAWKGYVLDTASTFQSKISQPLMRNKNQLMDFLDGEYFVAGNQLYKISDNLNIDPVEDAQKKQQLDLLMMEYKNKNETVTQENRLVHPSLLRFRGK